VINQNAKKAAKDDADFIQILTEDPE